VQILTEELRKDDLAVFFFAEISQIAQIYTDLHG